MFSNKILAFIFLFLVLGIALILTFYLLGYKIKSDNEDGLLVKGGDKGLVTYQNTNGPLFDAFGRQRISNQYIVFESKQIIDNDPLKWDETESGSLTGTWTVNRSSTVVTNGDGYAEGEFIRQTFRSFHYRPGHSQLIFLTGILTRSVPEDAPGLVIQYGQMSSKNGVFFEYSNNTMNCVVRSYVTGSAVDTKYPQNEWNIDKMDGTGESGITIDWSKIQIYAIDYGWLGADRIRYGVVIGGILYVVHEINATNIIDSIYMSQPDNPIRYRVAVTAETPPIISEQVCVSISTEGGESEQIGLIKSVRGSVKLPGSPDSSDNSNTLLIAFRLNPAKINSTIKFSDIIILNTDGGGAAGDNAVWELVFEPTLSVEINDEGGGPPEWTSVTNSSIQYFIGDGTIKATDNVNSTLLISNYSASGFKDSAVSTNDILNQSQQLLGAKIDDTPQIIVLRASALVVDNEIDSLHFSVTWKEY